MLIFNLFLIIIGGTIYHIIIPIWLTNNEFCIGIILMSSILYLIIFMLFMLIFSSSYYPKSKEEKHIIFKCGMFDILNTIFVTYSSPPNRIPAIMQPLLSNTIIIFGIFANKYIANDKRKYTNKYVIASIVCIFLSVIISSIPNFNHNSINAKLDFIFWIIVYCTGSCFYPMFNTYQTLYYKHIAELYNDLDFKKYKKIYFDKTFTLLFYQNVVRTILLLLLIWIDLIPSFGFSTSNTLIENINKVFINSFTISLNKFGPLYCTLFVLSNVASYIGACYLNINSAPFCMIVTSIIVPISICFWLIFPSLNYNSENTNVPLTVISIILTMLGIYIWKKWEDTSSFISLP